MPEIASLHPIVVHFVVALLFVGVPLRWVGLTGKVPWASPAARLLLLVGAAASVGAVRSGEAAHGPVEAMPGTRAMLEEHEALGEQASRIFLAVAALELLGYGLRRNRYGRAFVFGSALLGTAGLQVLSHAGGHGGDLVYAYAAGVGIRSGSDEDVGRLLKAGLHHQAQQDRVRGRPAEAARLMDEMLLRWPDDPEVVLAAARSALEDRGDPVGARALLESLPGGQGSFRIEVGLLMADVLDASGEESRARALLNSLAAEFPGNDRVRQRLQR